MTKYKERLELLYPNYTEQQLELIFELRMNFWK